MPAAIAMPAALARHHLQQPVQPSIRGARRTIESGLEDRLAVEVAARAMRDRHRVDDRELAGVPQRPQRRQTRRQAERVVERRRARRRCRRTRRAARGSPGRRTARRAARPSKPPRSRMNTNRPRWRDLREGDDRQAEGGDAAVAHGSDEVAALHHYLHWNAGPAMASAMRSGAEIGGVGQQSRAAGSPGGHVHDVERAIAGRVAASPAVSRSCAPARRD